MAANAILATGVMSASGSIAGAYSASRAYETQAEIRQRNLEISSKIADFEAEDVMLQGRKAGVAAKVQARAIASTQRARIAAGGVEVNANSAAQSQEDIIAAGETEAKRVENNAWRQAFGIKTQGAQYSAQAAYEGIAGREKSRASLLTGGLQAVGTGLETYVKYKGVA